MDALKLSFEDKPSVDEVAGKVYEYGQSLLTGHKATIELEVAGVSLIGYISAGNNCTLPGCKAWAEDQLRVIDSLAAKMAADKESLRSNAYPVEDDAGGKSDKVLADKAEAPKVKAQTESSHIAD